MKRYSPTLLVLLGLHIMAFPGVVRDFAYADAVPRPGAEAAVSDLLKSETAVPVPGNQSNLDKGDDRIRSVVSQVHVISVHVQDPATFDAVFLLFRDVFQLPLIYGELSKPGNKDQRFYAGFSVGNAYLEPCGPYKDDAPFSPDRPARLHGLTFSPATTIADAAKALGHRNIYYSEATGGGDLPRFVYLTDALLTGKRMAVSIWEIQNTNDQANLSFLHSALQQAKGGALGVKSIEDVRIGFPEKANLAQWGNFLSSTKHEGDVWLVGNGPVLRFVPGNDPQIESIVLRVESLEKAKTVLSQRNLMGDLTPDSVKLDPAKTWGLRIILREK